MIFLSFNVRGLGGVLKKKEVGRLIREHKPDFVFLQETKLEGVDRGLCRLLWGSDECDWVSKDSSGASGGLVCLWSKLQLVKLGDFQGDGFFGCYKRMGSDENEVPLSKCVCSSG
ncbi:hypothetical protein SLA2020_387080 [Shorea laevis]